MLGRQEACSFAICVPLFLSFTRSLLSHCFSPSLSSISTRGTHRNSYDCEQRQDRRGCFGPGDEAARHRRPLSREGSKLIFCAKKVFFFFRSKLAKLTSLAFARAALFSLRVRQIDRSNEPLRQISLSLNDDRRRPRCCCGAGSCRRSRSSFGSCRRRRCSCSCSSSPLRCGRAQDPPAGRVLLL